MHCEIEFGKHKGKTYEWVFFNDPPYATWLHENNVLRKRYDYDPYERDYFDELYARASCLAGTCEVCKAKPITKKVVYFNQGVCVCYRLCEMCKIPRLRAKYFSSLSMMDSGTWAAKYHSRVFHSLAEEYTGQEKKYSQEEMEAFFRNDANFMNATSKFFEDWEKEVDKR